MSLQPPMYPDPLLPGDIPLLLLPERLAVCRLPADAQFPDWARDGELLALVRTSSELSVVCAERFVPPEVKAERGWRVLQVQGPLDFSQVGVLASITVPLAKAGVSLFALSTYDTDYILVKESALERAVQALNQAGFLVMSHVDLSA
ncbi:MAG: ACT domain-containing protein [Chloroflexota bacterium]